MRKVRIAVCGLGFVGSETVRLLRRARRALSNRLGAGLEVAAVADRRVREEARRLGLGAGVFKTRDPLEAARRPDIDIVVELLGGITEPRRLVLESLRRGRGVVTANKWLLSRHWREVDAARRACGGRLYFEAAVGGAIPIVSALEDGLAADSIEAVYGILNGTTNFVLSRAERGGGVAEALREAQRLGLAEKDPAQDMDGTDTAHKLSVLSAVITGSAVPPRAIDRAGIEAIDSEDLAFARRELEAAVRLIGTLRLRHSASGVRLESSVAPTLVPLSHPLAAVQGENNAILVRAAPAGDLMFYGKGAGPGPAASAVAGDVLMLARELLGATPPPRGAAQPVRLVAASESISSFYVRLHVLDRPGALASIARALGRRRISIASIHQPEAGPGARGVPVVITTHPARAGDFRAALRDVRALAPVSRRLAVMRILS